MASDETSKLLAAIAPVGSPSPVLTKEEEEEEGSAVVAQFITKLWAMVNDKRYKHLISWSSNGKTFIVHNENDFAKSVLPNFFKHNNFTSFVRQLNLYGFRKVSKPDQHTLLKTNETVEFWHTSFRREHPELLSLVQRRVKGSASEDNLPRIMNDVHKMKGTQEQLARVMQSAIKENSHLRQEINLLKQKYDYQNKILNSIIHFIVHILYKGRLPRKISRLMLTDGGDSSEDDSLFPVTKKPRTGVASDVDPCPTTSSVIIQEPLSVLQTIKNIPPSPLTPSAAATPSAAMTPSDTAGINSNGTALPTSIPEDDLLTDLLSSDSNADPQTLTSLSQALTTTPSGQALISQALLHVSPDKFSAVPQTPPIPEITPINQTPPISHAPPITQTPPISQAPPITQTPPIPQIIQNPSMMPLPADQSLTQSLVSQSAITPDSVSSLSSHLDTQHQNLVPLPVDPSLTQSLVPQSAITPDSVSSLSSHLDTQHQNLITFPDTLADNFCLDPALFSDFVAELDFPLPNYDTIDTARLLESLSSDTSEVPHDSSLQTALVPASIPDLISYEVFKQNQQQ